MQSSVEVPAVLDRFLEGLESGHCPLHRRFRACFFMSSLRKLTAFSRLASAYCRFVGGAAPRQPGAPGQLQTVAAPAVASAALSSLATPASTPPLRL